MKQSLEGSKMKKESKLTLKEREELELMELAAKAVIKEDIKLLKELAKH